MTRRRLEARAVARDGGLDVLAPAVGFFSGAPRVGEVVVAGSIVGRIEILGEWQDIVLPAGVVGRIERVSVVHRREPVAFDQPLLRLVAVEAGGLEVAVTGPAAAGAEDLPEGTFPVVSPTHGMFYRRPKPESPAYVEVGQTVEEGATLALVEVMKCFSAIAYGGDGLPARAKIVDVRAEDGAEVAADQVLFVVEPADSSG